MTEETEITPRVNRVCRLRFFTTPQDANNPNKLPISILPSGVTVLLTKEHDLSRKIKHGDTVDVFLYADKESYLLAIPLSIINRNISPSIPENNFLARR